MRQVALGAFLISFAPIFVKSMDLGPTLIGAYRCSIAALILWLYLILFKSNSLAQLRSIPRKGLWLLALAGVFFFLDLYAWHRSVVYIGAGVATLLGNTQVFILAFLGFVLHRELLSKRYATSLLLAALGIYLLIGNIPSWVRPEDHLPGIIYGLATGVIYAAYILSLRSAQTRFQAMDTPLKFAVILTVSAVFLWFFSFVGDEVALPSVTDGLQLVALAVGVQIFGWLLITGGLPKIKVSTAGLLLLIQPTCAMIMGAIFFDENLSATQMIGALMTLMAIYFGSTQTKQPPKDASVAA